MKHARLAVAGLMFVGAFGAASADECQPRLVEVNQMSAQITTTSTQRQTLRGLGQAALLLDRAGRTDLCVEVVGEMQDVLEVQAARVESTQAKAARMQALANAVPLSTLTEPLDAAMLEGLRVVNEAGEELATVDRVVVEPNRGAVIYVALDRAGFLGMLSDAVAVPWSALRVTADRGTVVLAVSRDALADAPTMDEVKRGQPPATDWLD